MSNPEQGNPNEKLIHQPQPEKKEKPENKPTVEQLQGFPQSIQELFDKLPDEIKAKIFLKEPKSKPEATQTGNIIIKSFGWKTQEQELDEVIASLDKKDCERYANNCLSGLFFGNPDFKASFDQTTVDSVGPTITKLLDVLWNNRGKNKSEIKIFNQSRFDEYAEKSKLLNQKIDGIKQTREKIKTDIEKTRHQKRLNEKLRQQSYELIRSQEDLEKELRELDFQFNNDHFDMFGNIRGRKMREAKWTEALTSATEYLDPLDFSVLVSESIERNFFYRETSIARTGKFMNRVIDPEKVQETKVFMTNLNQAFEDWQAQHEQEGPLKKFKSGSLEAKQTKLIDYFRSLAGSYERGKEKGESDDDLLMNIRQMEVTLNLLAKSEKY